MKIFKKTMALLLTLALMFGMFPATVSAAEESIRDTSEISVEGTAGLGNMLSQEIMAYQETTETETEEYQEGYAISELSISGSTATVRYYTLEDATLVVSLYTEDGMQMITSATAPVTADSKEVSLTFSGQMPEYYQAAVFLLDTYNLAPLCPAYRTTLYTREMQELVNSSASDYDADRVINLDEDTSSNFLVCAESTIIIDYREGVNTVLTADDENAVYVIENPDAQIRNLAPGDVVVYPYGADSILIVNVETITINGSTATITGGDIKPEEVFDCIKIEGSGGNEKATIDESELDEGVTLAGSSGPEARTSAEGSAEKQFSFILNFVNEDYGEDESHAKELKATGRVDFGVQFEIKLYFTDSYKMVDFQVAKNVQFDLNVEAKNGKALGEAKLGKWHLPVTPIIGIEFTPKFYVEVSASAQFTATCGQKDGLLAECDSNGWRFSSTSEEPNWSFKTEFEGQILVGVKFVPDIQVLKGVLANAEFDSFIGVYLQAKLKVEPITNDDVIHACTGCLDGDFGLKGKLIINLRLFKSKILGFEITVVDRSLKLADYYICMEHGVPFKLGNCPDYLYKLTVDVIDEEGNPVSGADVSISSDDPEYYAEFATSGGTVVTHLAQAEYGVTASGDGGSARAIVEVHSPQMLTLILGEDDDDEEDGDGNILGSVEEDAIDGGIMIAEGTSDNIRWILYDSGLMLFVGSGKMNLYYGSDMPWKDYMSLIRYVFIQDGIENLEEYAFINAPNLEHIDFPASITDIGISACKNCESLESVVWPTNLQSIGSEAFRGTKITTLSLPTTLTSVGGYSFKECDALTAVNIGGPNMVVRDNAFEACSALSSVNIGAGSLQLSDKCFYNCESLSSVTLADTVTYIGVAAFAENEALISVQMSRGIEDIDTNAFLNCPNLTDFSGFHSVKTIGNGAFTNSGLHYVDLPDTTKTVGDKAFSAMPNLSSVSIDGSDVIIGADAFRNCPELWSVTISENVSKIGSYCFSNCTSLTDVTLKEGLTALSDGIFKNCTALETVGTPQKNTTLPNSVTSVGASAFAGCEALTKITLPNALTSVGNYAFQASGLTSITVPRTVTQVGVSAFQDCVELQTATIYSNGSTLGNTVFSGCEKLSSVTLGNGITSIGSNAFTNCVELTSISVPDTVTTIGSSAFSNCKKLSSVTLSDSLTAISDSLFYNCEELSTVYVPDSVTSIGANFIAGTKVSFIRVPAAVTTVKSYAFDSAKELSSVSFEGDKPTIGSKAFNYIKCTVSYPGGNETWGDMDGENYGGELTWVSSGSYSSPSSAAAVTSQTESTAKMVRGGNQIRTCSVSSATAAPPLTGSVSRPVMEASYSGSYDSEQVDDQVIRNASFQNLVPGGEYVLLALASLDTAEPLAAENLLFIDQASADETGNLSFRYVQREETAISYVIVCGPSNRDLADAVITFPEMTAGANVQAVRPTVVYEGKTLVAGRDYVILGTTSFTEGGTYTCYIRGIHNYAGLVECTYTVASRAGIAGDFNGDGGVDDADVAYLLWHTLFADMYPISIPADFTKDGSVDDADVAHLLWHTLFPDIYPL